MIFVLATGFASADETFPQPSELKPDVDFWISIFTRYSTDEGVITFDANVPLSGMYAFDFSNFNYSKTEAEGIATNLDLVATALNTRLDYPNKKIIIMIDMTDPAVEGWDVNDWNNHLIEVQN